MSNKEGIRMSSITSLNKYILTKPKRNALLKSNVMLRYREGLENLTNNKLKQEKGLDYCFYSIPHRSNST
jgi:hypothetical protein